MQVISEGSTTKAGDVETLAGPRTGRVGFGCLVLLASVAVLLTTGCSSEPLQPQGALRTGASKARVGTSRAGSVSDSASLTGGIGSVGVGEWPYSGRRRQSSSPPTENFVFKGDPNANGTFAPGPAQM